MSGKVHNLITYDLGLLKPGGSPIALIQPPHRMEFGAYGSEVTWSLQVAAVSGAPTTWSLAAKFQWCLEHTGGWQYTDPKWFDYDALQVSKDVAEAVGWYTGSHTPPVGGAAGVVADNTDTLPVQANRTVLCRTLRHRVAFDLTMAGGTDPGLRVNLAATVRR